MEEQPFVAQESKKQRKKREKELKRQRGEAEQQAQRAAKQQRHTDQASPLAVLDNAAYAAVFGPGARGSVVLKPEYALAANRFHLNPTHLQLLVAVAGGTGTNHSASPFVLGHQALIRRVVVVSLGGVTLDLVDQRVSVAMQEMFPFGHSVLVGPGSQNKAYHVPPMVLRTPTAKSREKGKKREKDKPAALTELLATLDQLRDNEFPLAEGPDALEGLPAFVSAAGGAGGVALAALDCEMVSTVNGLELGRVSLVGPDMAVIWDSFVAPVNPVLDYNTRYSGLTAEALQGAPSLLSVRARFLELVTSSTVLAGHSLDNDLRCLRVVHTRIADTSLLYPHTRGPPYKRSLRDLATTYLNEAIQEGEHCSIQDASVAMRLLLLKQSKGLAFAVPTKEFVSLWEGVRDRSGALLMSADLAEPLKGVTGEGIGAAQLSATATTAEEVLEQAGQQEGTLVYALLPDCFDAEKLLSLCASLKSLVYDKLPSGTLLVAHGGRGPLATLLELQAARKGTEDDPAIAKEALRIRSMPFWMHVK